MEKPISLILEEAKQEYVNQINEINNKYGLSMYFVDIILGGIYSEVNKLKNQELEQAQKEFETTNNEKQKGKKE